MTDSPDNTVDNTNDNAIAQKRAVVSELACGVHALAEARYAEAHECFRAAALWAEAASLVKADTNEVAGKKWQVQIVPRTPPSDDSESR